MFLNFSGTNFQILEYHLRKGKLSILMHSRHGQCHEGGGGGGGGVIPPPPL